jgi:hypothetical protein
MAKYRDFRDLKDLPEGFDPEAHSREFRLEHIKAKDLYEGVYLLYAEGNDYILAKVKAGDDTTAPEKPVVRCWRCQGNPDGSIDCFSIPCPWEKAPA